MTYGDFLVPLDAGRMQEDVGAGGSRSSGASPLLQRWVPGPEEELTASRPRRPAAGRVCGPRLRGEESPCWELGASQPPLLREAWPAVRPP